MEIQGRIVAVLAQRNGTSARGTDWALQEYVLETHDQYSKKVCFEVFGADRIARFGVRVGQEVTVFFDLESREWQGKWFTSVRAYDVRLVEGGVTAAPVTAVRSAPVVTQNADPLGLLSGTNSEEELPY